MNGLRAVGFSLLFLTACGESGEALDRLPHEPPRAPEKVAPKAARPALVQTVSWSSSIDVPSAKELSDLARSELAHSPVPVLVVAEAKLLRAAILTTGPHWYAVAAKDGGLTVALSGTRLAYDYPEIPTAHGRSTVRGRPAFFTENEGIVSASWVENGVAYALDLECFDRHDARCHGAEYLLTLAEKLRYVGGEGSAR